MEPKTNKIKFSFEKFRDSMKGNKRAFKQGLYIFSIMLLYLIISMSNFGGGVTFDGDALKNRDFWTNYAIVMLAGIFIMFLSIETMKEQHKSQPRIEDELECLRAYKFALQSEGLYEKFRDYLDKKRNPERKLEKYRSMLVRARDTAKKKKKQDYYSELLKETFSPEFKIESVRVKVKPITANTIFEGMVDKEAGGSVFFSGVENLFARVAPFIILSVIITVLILSVNLNDMETNANQWKDFLTVVWVTFLFILSGITYADYSINTVFLSVLDNRKGEVRMFLARSGYSVKNYNNDTFKYAAKITPADEKSEDINNG